MQLLEWSDDLLIGESKIDAQHKEIVEKYNKVVNVLNANLPDSGTEARSLLSALHDDLIEHFEHEEQLLVQFNCEFTKLNIQEHKFYISQFNKLIALTRRFGFTENNKSKLNKLVKEMIIRHMQDVDSKLAKYFK